MPHSIPIHIVDYQDRNYHYISIGNSYYYGNEYFFTNLAKISGGMSLDQVGVEYDLPREDIRAALAYAGRVIADEEIRLVA